ncbi:terminase small subunit [Bordetella petrii]|uniref:Uncharacterized protein n=1 Tax=Bordetella petrii (strain ATCC BAA-461 / DSM 12804 / CCUG 43448 / CIP 107267 / Se-1111R) TaxID=340100 RepID=A9IRX2_BORPD|nr:terminase small subunit [Bordetella petrii]CAP43228.1 hypothetical protein Bpet2886 [Bordetella petrii]
MQLAALAGVSARRIRQLAEQGTLERVGRNEYALGPSIRALIDDAAGTGSVLQRERTRLVRAQADEAELRLAEAKKLVAPIEQYAEVWAHRCGIIRANMLNVPGRVVSQLLGENDESRFKATLRAEIIEALKASADPNFGDENLGPTN